MEIILDVTSSPPFMGSFTATWPDGTTYPVSGHFPISMGGVGGIQNGVWTFTDNNNLLSPTSVSVNCGEGGGGGYEGDGRGGKTGCDAIAGVYDCVFNLNKRYEELECVNDKRAQKEKIKLDRVMQLFQLAEFDCECGMNDINEYIREIKSIANCDDCEKKLSIVSTEGHGCTDPDANNYDSFATVDDGSCSYSQNCVEVTMSDGTLKSETLIPDPVFETWLENQGYGNGVLDGKVCTANLIAVSSQFDIDGSPLASGITDLTGITDFENVISYINIGNTSVSTIDLSNGFTSLLKIYANFMPNLTLANFTNLNNLTQVQITGNDNLTKIILGSNINLANLSLWAANNHSSLQIDVGTAARVTQAQSLFTVGNGNISTGTTFIA
jgi:hypothetical protein